jgi:hypothetical protein
MKWWYFLKIVMPRGRRLKKGDGEFGSLEEKCCFIIIDN